MLRPAVYDLQALFKRITLTVFLLFAVFFANSQVLFNTLEDSVFADRWIGLQTIQSGEAFSGTHYSVIDSVTPFGLGLESYFPNEIAGKNTQINISGWLKSETDFDEAVFVISIKKDGKDILWKGIHLGPLILEKNKWFYFSDSLRIPASVSETAIIKAYLWNSDGKYRLGLDDLKFTFLPIQNPSYFPQIDTDNSRPTSIGKTIFKNGFYTCSIDQSGDAIQLLGRSDSSIIENIWYYQEEILKKKKKITQLPLRFKKSNALGDVSELLFTVKGMGTQVKMICRQNSPEIQFQMKSKYKRNQEIIRQSLVLKSTQYPEEVFRNNRKSDTEVFQDEYWLNREGVKFGENENSFIVYHSPQLSSLQLKSSEKLLAINMDYDKDHPHLHFPLDKDTVDLKQDWSNSKYTKSTKRQYSFSIFVGTKARNLPRIMKNPNGFLATYIWTEHADWTDIRTNRATYFGSEKISTSENATGGFVRYNIPVTKSVFWDNPDKINNLEISGGTFTSEESTIMNDTTFRTFLNQLHAFGHDICLHTPEQYTTNRGRLKKALGFMRSTYGSPSWIDHGYNNKLQNNREDLVCDGCLEKSDYFALNLWEKYEVKYLWNPYYEEYATFSDLHFSNCLEKPYSGFGDFMPHPDYWQHPSRTQHLYHWPTSSVLYVTSNDLWDYFFGKSVLELFVNDWAVEINHCYPAWVDPAKGFWIWNEDSEIIASPGFNRTLQRMANLRDDGLLNLTTIRDFMDYQTAIEWVGYKILADGGIRVTNNSSGKIKGISFATRSRFLLVDGVSPSQKVVGDDLIFWFDLDAGESKVIRVFE